MVDIVTKILRKDDVISLNVVLDRMSVYMRFCVNVSFRRVLLYVERIYVYLVMIRQDKDEK